jgi:predicted transglutaminase-like cysteine proteinase
MAASGCASLNDETVISSTLPRPETNILESGQSEAAPPGFIGFCLRTPGACDTLPEAVNTVTIVDTVWREMVAVNRQINADIRPMSDMEHYKRAEFWTIPTDGYGDCDDYALAKRKALIDAGFPRGALRIAVVMTLRHERHAILTVSTDRGDFVLDNLVPEILPWSQANYFWLERQDPTRSWGWVALKDDGAYGTLTVAATGE